jgi:hypothetical protein
MIVTITPLAELMASTFRNGQKENRTPGAGEQCRKKKQSACEASKEGKGLLSMELIKIRLIARRDIEH